MFHIRQTESTEETDIHRVHREAFGLDAGGSIADLTLALLHDPTAKPLLSLMAHEGVAGIGHVLFTRVHILGVEDSPVAYILAPLAVVPDHQRREAGTELVQTGLKLLAEAGCALVFVLGHPEYYPRFGFRPAGRLGLSAPYPIAEENADAWMVLELKPGVIGTVRGTIQCAESLNKQEYWVE